MAATGGPNSLQTLTDIELQGLEGGAPMEARAASEMFKRAAMTGQRGTLKPQATGDLALVWGDLKQRNPAWRGAFWEECRALYAGGYRLLNTETMRRLFPANLFEDPQVYKERCARAHYFPYAGTILDHLVAGLSSDPLLVSFAIVDPENGTRIRRGVPRFGGRIIRAR